jgi:hypothetical protein
VGKSYLAGRLASTTRNPLWDLGDYNLGDAFFTGTIIKKHGRAGYDAYLEALKNGSDCLILDALDEALVRSGLENVQASLADLVSLLPATSSGPVVIILGREDTISEASSILLKAGVQVTMLTVNFFTEDRAREYVQAKSDRKVAALEQELDLVISNFFTKVQHALGAHSFEEAKSFLGYSPVLEALSAAYDRDENGENPLKRLNAALEDDGDVEVWKLLGKVVGGILQRETDKFSNSFGGSDARKVAFAANTYNATTQFEMLLHSDPDQHVFDFPDEGDAEWLTELDTQIRSQFREHPFLQSSRNYAGANALLAFSNVVFRDFVIAWALGERRLAEYRLTDLWNASSLNPSPLLSKFAFYTNERGAVVEADAIGMLCDSHSADFYHNHVLVITDFSPEEGTADAEGDVGPSALMSIALTDKASQQERTLFAEMTEEPLVLRRVVSGTMIDTPSQNVQIGSGQRDFLVGPDVFIRCQGLEAVVPEVRIVSSATQRVIVDADSISGSAQRVLVYDRASFSLTAKNSYYPWIQFVSPARDVETFEDSDLYAAGMEMRRIISWFSKTSMLGGGLRYPAGAFDSIINKGRASRSLFEFLRTSGRLRTVENEYHIELTFNPMIVRTNSLENAEYKAFLIEYVASTIGADTDTNQAS